VTPTFSYRDIGNWGFNAVRLSVSWDALEPAPPTHGADGKPVHAWDPTYLAQLDQAIAGFHSHGVAVILAMSQHLWSPAFTNLEHGGRIFPTGAGMPAWLYPQGGGLCEMVKAEKGFFIRGVGQSEFRAAWRFLAGRYARNPAVIGADMLNEPYDVLTSSYPCTAGATPKTMKLARFYEATGKSIHRANSHLLLMFQEQKSRRTKRWALTRKPVLPNSVFDMHLYAPSWDQGRDRLGAAYRRAAHWHLPVWVGEWTMYNRTTNMQDAFAKWQYSSKKTLAYCKEHGISWDVLGYGAGRFQKATAIRTPKAGVLKTVRGGF
jgi:hypothetical protein